MSRGIPFGELPDYPGPLCMGMTGEGVELFQEMMNLLGFQLTVDGKFAQATRSALHAMTGKDVLEERIWRMLLKPLEHALKEIPGKDSIAVTGLAYAKKHLRAGATALPGPRGPWVRLYNQGYEGPEHYWPAGFIYFCIAQAHNSFSKLPKGDRFVSFPFTLECSEIAEWAQEVELLVTDLEGASIPPGSLFLEGAADFDAESNPRYTHVGFVDEFYGESFTSVEGSMNDKVIAKYRAFGARVIHFVPPQPV